jgi:hypothetical protein
MPPAENAKATDKYSIRIPVRFSHFYLSESAPGPDSRQPWPDGGLITIKSGQIKFIAETRLGHANLSIEVYDCSPIDVIGTYDDVVEKSYACESGELTLLNWSKELIHRLNPLPAGQSIYRVRYHIRHGVDLSEDSITAGDKAFELLVQIWPSPPTAPAELKISSSSGRFWHPHTKLVEAHRANPTD